MTTVIDPGGTPEPIYTRSGTTIAELSGVGTDQSGGAPILGFAGWTVVLISSTTNDYAVVLPGDAEVGDLVEVHAVSVSGHLPNVFPESGASIDEESTNAGISIDPDRCRWFRRVAVDKWRSIAR